MHRKTEDVGAHARRGPVEDRTQLQRSRPVDIRRCLSTVSGPAGCTCGRQARDCHPLAPCRVQSLLALAVEAAGGRPTVPLEFRQLIREMSLANPLWGAPRIHGELLKLGITIGQTSVAKYMARRRGPPSQGWRTFLRNHADGIAAIDLFVVPTISFRLLYGLLLLRHDRRRLLWLGATTHPTAEWIARQLTEAYGWDEAPRYLVRDRDRSYGEVFVRRVRAMGIRDRPTSPRSPWQNAYAERLIGSIRQECIDHVIVFGERHLRHLLRSYLDYYNETRTHLSLDKDAPISRAIQAVGRIVGCPVPGGLHHQYVRILICDRDTSVRNRLSSPLSS